MHRRFAIGLLLVMLPLIASAATTCATLSLGSTGPSVTAVQKVLYDAYQGFPSPTGYFGSVTQAALKQWQSEHKIVSSGTPATTGYGAVGPKTRVAMGLSCTASVSSAATTKTTQPSSLQLLLAQLKALQDKIAGAKGGSASTTSPVTTTVTYGGGGGGGGGSSGGNSIGGGTSSGGGGSGGGGSGGGGTTLPTPAVCTFNSQSVASGASVTAYQSSSVPSGSQCVSQTRSCTNGTLSGSYTNAACTVSATPQNISAVSLGQDGSDIVGTTAIGADGTIDAHIRLIGVTTPISSVRITPDVGSGVWQWPGDGTALIVAVRPESNPTIVDLYFTFNKNWSYNVKLTFTDGSSATTLAAPTVQCSGNQACFNTALNNLYAHFWTGAHDTGYITPTSWLGYVGNTGSDPRGSWTAETFLYVLSTQYVLNPTDANAQPIRAEWNHLKSIYSDSDFTGVGAISALSHWSDDLAWDMAMLLEIYDVTHDDHALALAKAGLQNGWNHWHNENPKFGGGMWYTDDHTEEALVQVRDATDFFRVYQLTNDQTYLAKAEELYNWFQTHLLFANNPWYVSHVAYPDGVYYMDYGWWSSDNPATDMPHVNWWNSIHEGSTALGASQTYLPGEMGMDVMHARMYRLTGDNLYLQRAIVTAQSLITNFVGDNGAFFADRDAGTNGTFVREWILEVYPLLPSDLQQKFKTAFQRTALAIQVNDTTSDGYYGPDLAGPVDAVWSNNAANTDNKQITTNTAVVDFIAAPALIDYAGTLPVQPVLPPAAKPSVTASLLGNDGGDVVGKTTVGADTYPDVHIKLTGVSTPLSGVRITSPNGPGAWQWPGDGTTWIVAIKPESDPTVVDLYFEYYQPYSSYSLALTFQDGTTKTLTAQ